MRSKAEVAFQTDYDPSSTSIRLLLLRSHIISSLEVKCHSVVQQRRCFQTRKLQKPTQEAHLLSCHIKTLADNLDPPCVMQRFPHASVDQNTGQLLNATVNQVKNHVFFLLFFMNTDTFSSKVTAHYSSELCLILAYLDIRKCPDRSK